MISVQVCWIRSQHKRFHRLLRITDTYAQMRAAGSDYRISSKHCKAKACSQVIASLAFEIGNESNLDTQPNLMLLLLSPARPNRHASDTYRIPIPQALILYVCFHWFYICAQHIEKRTARASQTIHETFDSVKPQDTIQILERQHDFCTEYELQQHC